MLVANAIEQGLAPGLVDVWGKHGLLDGVLNLGIVVLTTNFPRVGYGIVDNLKVVLVYYFTIGFIKQSEQSFVRVTGVGVRFEFTVANEVLSVHSVEGLDVGSKSANIKADHLSNNLATETRLL